MFALFDGYGSASRKAAGGGVALAAVRREVGQQVVHHGIFGRVDQGPALTAEFDQMRMLELVQMKGQRCTRQPEPVANLSRGHPLRTGLDQKPENIEAGFLREGRQSGDGIYFLHISIYMEIQIYCQPVR